MNYASGLYMLSTKTQHYALRWLMVHMNVDLRHLAPNRDQRRYPRDVCRRGRETQLGIPAHIFGVIPYCSLSAMGAGRLPDSLRSFVATKGRVPLLSSSWFVDRTYSSLSMWRKLKYYPTLVSYWVCISRSCW